MLSLFTTVRSDNIIGMSLSNDILTILTSYSGGYAVMRARMRGDTRRFGKKGPKEAPDGSYRVALSRLRKKGLVDNNKGIWKITLAGRERIASKILPRHSKKRKGVVKNMIVVFDIPENDHNKRDWLRFELQNLGFSLLQKSVWFGPAPLPTDFIEAIESLGLGEYLKFFQAKEADII